MLPVPIDAASAVMNAWNGVSAPVVPVPRRTNATRQASPNRRTCTTPEPQRQEQPGAEQEPDDPRHEQRVGERLNRVGEGG